MIMVSLSNEEIEKAGKRSGLEIWRIENMKMVPVSSKHHGHFFVGDSYIVLHTERQETGGCFSWNLHFWLGDESSQNEKAASAILSTKLDEHLGGSPIQYREVQNKESNVFRGYFKKGITYKKGGVSSGFKHARTNVSDVKRLLHVKGRRTVRATEVEMSWKSFNQGDIFIVEVENDIYQWNGSKSNRFERLKACQLVGSIKTEEKGGKGVIHVLDEGDPIPKKMLQALSGSPSDVGPEISDDVVCEKQSSVKPADLYHVSSDSGKLVVEKIASAPFSQTDLKSGDCFIVDNGANKLIFVWKGKQASKDERSGAMNNAVKFIKDHGYHPATKIQVMAEGAESVVFTQYFKEWKRKDETVGVGKAHTFHKIAKIDKAKFDVKSLHKAPKFAAEQGMVDDGSGKVEVWRVEGNKLAEVKKEDYGNFFAGDCYVILYTYKPKLRDEYILYSWQGQNSTKDEIAASAYFATGLADKYDGRPIHCKVVQGKEPKHLLNIFGHPLIITSGGYDKKTGKTIALSTTALYQVRSSALGGTKLIQVQTSASSLNSNDAFLLKHQGEGFIWVGLGANDDEIEAAKYGAGKFGITLSREFEEGQEPEEFWRILGGKKDYANSPRLQQDLTNNPPKLFAISNARGQMFVEEIAGEFVQSDLEPDDVMMLDTWDQVFIWIGEGSNTQERKEAPKLAMEYIAEDPRSRDRDCPVITVKMNAEPVTFIGFFPSWDDKFFENQKSYSERMKQLSE